MTFTNYSFRGLQGPCSNADLTAYLYEVINNIYSDLYPGVPDNKEYFAVVLKEVTAEGICSAPACVFIYDSCIAADEKATSYEYYNGISVEFYVINKDSIRGIKHKEYFESCFSTYPGVRTTNYVDDDMRNALFMARKLWDLESTVTIVRQ